MNRLRLTVAVGATAVFGLGAVGARSDGAGHTLAVRDGADWVTGWREETAPVRWGSETPLARRVVWRASAAGVEWGDLHLRGAREAWRTRVVLVRIDPRHVDFSLVPAFARNTRWTVADADSGAVVALDAGQFRHSLPWGWVVSQGHEVLAPEHAPLAGAVVVDPSGAVRLIAPDSVAAERKRGTAREAFQSYPMLLQDGVVPSPLSEPGRGVNVEHRDARLALGTLPDGRVLVALTRFNALGPSLGWVPFGLTSAEMASVMGALGCRDALLLDGGISGQLMVREPGGAVRSWPGSRSVPLGLVIRSRVSPAAGSTLPW
jgi:uncharacterized protein YigE (DUF2233 family)